MGLFSSGKRKSRKQKVEPRLFSDNNRRQTSSRRKPARRRSLLGWLFRTAFVLSFWGVVALAGLFGYIWFTLNENGQLKIPDREPGVMLLASDGTLLAEQGSFYGDDARLSDLPDYVPNAVIAIEDRRFRSHFGVDPIGLARAMYTNYRSGRLVQGGSTLTQQLAKNLFLSADRAIWRKLQEVVLAVWLEAHFSKDEILQLYLNRVYYGAGATGIEKAARTYYNKPATELSLMEAATLAGVLKAPTNYSPATHPDRAAERARLVLASMVEAGFITSADAQQAKDSPQTARPSDYVPAKQYIVDWVNEQLPDLIKTYDQSIVIETTIDQSIQTSAEKSLRKRLNEDGAKLSVSQGAVVVLDGAGAVRAMVGGKSYKRSQFNRVTKAKRQPGSAFKPFLYVAAVEQGFTPDTVEVDEPVRYGNWQPENYRQKYLGSVTLEKALALSLNTIAAKLVMAVGPDAVVAVAHRFGITSELSDDPSIALGTSEVTPLELTAAFVPFSNGGVPVVPYGVTRISTRDGRVLYERSGAGFPPAISSHDLGAMNRMLQAVVSWGTGKKAAFPGFPIGGKTGTSQDYRDAWFVGYTSDLVAGVWVGNDDNSPTKRVTGGSLPALIWRDVMEPAHQGLTPHPLPGGDQGGDPSIVSLIEQDSPGIVAPSQETDTPRKSTKGFFESVGNLFGGSEDRPPEQNTREKKSISAYERMKKIRERR